MIKKPILIATRSSKVKDCRILTPQEVDIIAEGILKDHHETLFYVLLWSGMRYVEVQRMHKHPEWYDKQRNQIFLNREAQKKVKRVAPLRYVTPLPYEMKSLMKDFYKMDKVPSPQSFSKDLKRWAVRGNLDPVGLSQKSFRKTIETWLFHAGMSPEKIAMRQGHNMNTAYEHYISTGFDEVELEMIKKRVGTWI